MRRTLTNAALFTLCLFFLTAAFGASAWAFKATICGKKVVNKKTITKRLKAGKKKGHKKLAKQARKACLKKRKKTGFRSFYWKKGSVSKKKKGKRAFTIHTSCVHYQWKGCPSKKMYYYKSTYTTSRYDQVTKTKACRENTTSKECRQAVSKVLKKALPKWKGLKSRRKVCHAYVGGKLSVKKLTLHRVRLIYKAQANDPTQHKNASVKAYYDVLYDCKFK